MVGVPFLLHCRELSHGWVKWLCFYWYWDDSTRRKGEKLGLISAYPTKNHSFFFFLSFFFFFECSLCVCIVVWVCGSFCLWVCSLVDGILQECVVKTSKGSISVFVCGDQEKPALITYPDVALNCMPHFLFMFCKSVLICLFFEIVLVGSCGLIHICWQWMYISFFLLFFLLNFRKMLIYVWLKMVLMGFVLQFHYVENECFFVYLVVLFSKIYDSQCFLLDFFFIGLFSFSPRIWKGTVGVFCFQKLMC